ncbi:hypothetical protein D187_003205 [Cystobacter fuscus DSM 2262]|uniref:Uncharacterized protein n=1 Tax=Cystobacter fuscus (strain ATCC 25194 / DSM 2262 / NBRC 100088 / M29) TaxID=1242864 RepID=S9P831_CYSF2|nr:hypothetical protein [Cystobacter fuscus]EPX59301.1 hypothetical protein D187_003205 [Cystobacter fuscus DSM 2262]
MHRFDPFDTVSGQPELDTSSETAVPSTAQSSDGTITLERKSGTPFDANRNALSSGDLSVIGLAGVPFATLEAVETARYEDTSSLRRDLVVSQDRRRL